MDREWWLAEVEGQESELGSDMGFKLLFCPWATINNHDAVFISLNPGVAPANADLRVLSDERGNSYEVEAEYTASPITKQFLLMCDFLELTPSRVLTGVAAPYRSSSWGALSRRQREASLFIGRRFWREALRHSKANVIVACSAEAAKVAVHAVDAAFTTELPAGWGNTKLTVYTAPDRRRVLHLPHLSRFKLFGRPESEARILQALGS